MTGPSLRTPEAVLPIAMSLSALALVLGHAAVFGVVHESDEGTAAHMFQLLMVAQVPVVLFCSARWIPRAPSQALRVLALQAAMATAALASVFWLT